MTGHALERDWAATAGLRGIVPRREKASVSGQRVERRPGRRRFEDPAGDEDVQTVTRRSECRDR